MTRRPDEIGERRRVERRHRAVGGGSLRTSKRSPDGEMRRGPIHFEAERRQPEDVDAARAERTGLSKDGGELVVEPARTDLDGVANVACALIDRGHDVSCQVVQWASTKRRTSRSSSASSGALPKPAMRRGLHDVQVRFHPGGSQGAVHAHGVREEQSAFPSPGRLAGPLRSRRTTGHARIGGSWPSA